MKKTLTTLITSAAFIATSHASVTITTADWNGADTFLTNDSNSGPTANFGASTTMELRQWTDTRTRLLYIRFDISNLVGTDYSGATITLNGVTVNRSRPLDFRGVVDGTTDGQGENWNESTISFSDAAGLATTPDDTALNGNYSFTTAATSTWIAHTSGSAVGANTTVASSSLDSFIAADTNGLITFIVDLEEVANASEDFFFTTKEGNAALAPSITFPNLAIPEPSAALLGSLGLLGLLRRKRA